MTKVMLVDDEEKALKVLCRSLTMLDYNTVGVSDPRVALDTLRKEAPDVVIVDLIMPHIGGMEVLDLIKKTTSHVPVIVLTGYGTVKTAVEAMRRGAFDYVTKPYDIDEIDLTIKRALEQRVLFLENQMLKERLLRLSPLSDIITHDKSMKKLLQQVQTLADTDSTVLITGESGTGKELIAKALHFCGNRRDKPFITIDCSGLPETILESEVFGHVKGSYTGAYTDKKGYIEVAEGGSVFFDEIGELPFLLQKKLLRVAQEKEFSRVGDTKSRKANIRLIAATNRDLEGGDQGREIQGRSLLSAERDLSPHTSAPKSARGCSAPFQLLCGSLQRPFREEDHQGWGGCAPKNDNLFLAWQCARAQEHSREDCGAQGGQYHNLGGLARRSEDFGARQKGAPPPFQRV